MSEARLPPRDKRGEVEIFLVAVEESGDRLGAALMRALRQRASVPVRFAGVGGREMAAAGLDSLLSVQDFSVIGFTGIPARLPRILRHLRLTVHAVLDRRPNVLVIIDSPAYTLWVARLVHRQAPAIPIIDYVSPSVWAWRSKRAPAMRKYIAHVLALLPFEPVVHRKLGGPPCSYVGHPLIEEVSKLRPNEAEAQRRRCRSADHARYAGQPQRRGSPARRCIRRSLGACARARRHDRGRRADGAASAATGRASHRRLDHQAAHHGRSGGNSADVPDRPRGACEVRHHDARACSFRRSDGRGLYRIGSGGDGDPPSGQRALLPFWPIS